MRRVISVDGLFDGTAVIENASIVIVDGEVAWVGKRARAPKTPRGERSEEIRAPGPFLLPGLVNCHAHLTLDGSADFTTEARQSDAQATLKAFRNARAALRTGVTTTRDLGANGYMVIELSRAIAAGVVEGPRIVAAGRGITTTGGHGIEIGRIADGPDEVRRAAREQLAAGASVVKIFSTGGVLGEGARPEVSQLTLEETTAAVEEAHKSGVRATTHAHGAAGVQTAARAGIDSVEHATLLDARTVRLLKERGVAIVPTLSAIRAILDNAEHIPAQALERARMVGERHVESVRMARKAGVRIGAGTDAGTPFNRHDRFAGEIELLREAGSSALEALVSATSGAAAIIGAPKAGRLVPGSWADLLFVDGDPLRDLAVLRAPKGVWVRGARVV